MIGAGLRAGQFGRQQAADAEEARLQGERLGPGRLPARAQFGQALHGPDIVLESEGSEEALPQRLLPADLPGAGLKLRCLALQSHVRRLVEQVQHLRRRQVPQRGTAVAAQFFRQRLRRLTAEPQAELAERGVERLAQHEGGRRAGGRLLAVPNHMQDDVLEGGIAVMAVGVPAAGTEVHFHIARPRRVVAELHDRSMEIGAALHAAKAGMKDSDRLVVQGLELIAEQSLVLPDGLQQAFGRRVPVVPQDRDDAGAHAPLGIKAGQDRRHLAFAFALKRVQCQALEAAMRSEWGRHQAPGSRS